LRMKSRSKRRPLANIAMALVCFGWSLLATADVVITEDTDEGIDCFKIVTDSATYYFDKAGAGFTSIVDTDGNDWIDFHPEGTPGVDNGQSGWYRGIPNMGLNVFGHPGYTGATSTTSDSLGVPLSKATVQSTKDSWDVTWEFFPLYAKMTVNSVGENYWFLYEGTPGGAVGGDDTCHRSSGESTSLSGSWEGDVENTSGYATGLEWVFFADGTLDRSLFLAHDDDDLVDRYYLMDPMTVFGFGRHSANLNRLMSATPATLLIGLVGSRDFDTVAQVIETAHSGTTQDGGPGDAGDAGVDAGPGDPGVDAGPGDPGFDAGPGDPGIDAGPGDPGVDAGPGDLGVDAGPGDPRADAGPGDPGIDAGPSDPGADAGSSNTDQGSGNVSGSCGCDTNANPYNLAWLLAIFLLGCVRLFARER
jgi:hypothetical protein